MIEPIESISEAAPIKGARSSSPKKPSPKSPRWNLLERRLSNLDSSLRDTDKEIEELIGSDHLTNLGSGGNSIGTFTAHSNVLKKEIVVKVVRNKHALQLNREVQMTMNLKHEHIRSALDPVHIGLHFSWARFHFSPGNDLFIMTIQNSPPLPRKAPRKSRDLPVLTGIRHVFKAICVALQYLHFNKVVYNDLKPENIVVNAHSLGDVTKKTKVALIDFGLSFYLGERKEYAWGGTVDYSPPEKYIQHDDIGTPGDIFSFGVLLNSICTQRQLFQQTKVPADEHYDALVNAIANLHVSLKQSTRGAYAYEPVKEVILRTVKFRPQLRATATQLLELEFFASDKEMEAEQAQLN
jgi:serine/threonine protein kinase